MKRIKYLLLFIICFLCIKVVYAETFVEGKYLSGEYISKRKDGAIHYLTLQYLKDSNGDIVYCLEPYTKFVSGKSYTSYEGDLNGYNDLSENQKRKISLIVYYGYGYSGRTQSKWYAVTQFLIWDTVVNSDGSIYFTDTLNGNKISKYVSEINEVLKDVNNHDVKPSFVKNYESDYGKDLVIGNIGDYEVVKSSYNYQLTNGLVLKNVLNNGSISVSKASNYYKNKVAIFDSTQSQDLIRPGNVNNIVYDIRINVKKGNITLDIKKDDSVYTVESDFNNTCYDVLKDNTIVDSVCTKNQELVYKTIDLAYGEYEIKQKSNGLGYRKDESSYKVIINANNTNPVVNLYNLLIRNNIAIKKYACKEQVCNPESDAKFSIYDIKGNLINNIVTDKNGDAKIELGYGSYDIKQISGLFSYSIVDQYKEKITDEKTSHFKELFNYYKEKETEEQIEEPKEEKTKKEVEKPIVKEVKNEVVENKEEEISEKEEEVPDTGIKESFIGRLFYKIMQIIVETLNKIENTF